MTGKSVSRWVVLLIAGLLSFQLMASSAKLVQLLVDQAGLSELLVRKGIRGDAALQVKGFVDQSLRSLNFRNSTPSANQLKELINSMKVGDEDALLYKNHLKKVLDTPAGDLSKKDVADAINGLIYLANRHGRRGAIVLACANCTSSTLSEHGIKFTLQIPRNAQSKKVLTSVLPRKPKDLRRFINSQMRNLKMGDFSKVSGDSVSTADERALGLFVALGSRGSKSQKDLVEAIIKVSGDSGELFNSGNPHRLWKLFADDISDSQVEGWTRLLKEVDKVSKSEDKALKDAFYEVLERRAKDENIPMSKVENMKKKSCFFGK